MAADIKLNPITHDLAITKGELTFTEEKPESVAQRLKIKLLMFLGEWKFNIDFGVPYYQRIFEKGITKPVVDSIFRQQIIETPEVIKLISYSSDLNAMTREYSATFTVQAVDGQEITLSI
jgi:hypothetical protein